MIRSIRAKLVLLFVTLAAFPMIFLGVASYLNSLASVEAVVARRTAAAAQGAAAELQGRYGTYLDDIGRLARSQEIADLFARHPQVGDAAVEEVRPLLSRSIMPLLSGAQGAFARVSCLDREGTVLLRFTRNADAGGGAESARHRLTSTRASLDSVDLSVFEASGSLLALADLPGYGPVLRVAGWVEDRSTGARIGMLLADIEIDRLVGDGRFSQAFGAGEYLLLLDRRSGGLLFHPPGTTGQDFGDFAPGLTAQRLVAAHGPSGTLPWGTDAVGGVVAYVHQDEPPLTVVAISNAAPFTGLLRRAGARNLGLTLLSTAVTLVLLLWMATRITRSIRQVTAGAKAIADGNLDQQITVGSNDETSILADTFNRMSATLKKTMGELRELAAELDDRVRQRTASLEAANRSLEIERILERVRTQIAAMRDSRDIASLQQSIRDELRGLGVDAEEVNINIVDEGTSSYSVYGPEGLQYQIPIPMHLDVGRDFWRHWKEGITWSRLQSWEITREWVSWLWKQGHVTADAEEIAHKRFSDSGRWTVDVPFVHGTLAMSRRVAEPYPESDIRLLERFTQVFELGYRRHLDLRAAEERARRAELERAAERVRAEALAMRSSDDLPKVAGTLHQAMLDMALEVQWSHIQFANETAGTVSDFYAYSVPAVSDLSWTDPQTLQVLDEVLVTRRSPKPLGEWADLGQWRKGEPWLSEWESDEEFAQHWAEDIGLSELRPWVSATIAGTHAGIVVPFEYGVVRLTMREQHPDYVATIQELSGALALGFTRFLDFQRLEEQNRDLEVERALERIRTQVAAMETSEDLPKVVRVVEDSLVAFGVPCETVGITLASQETGFLGFFGTKLRQPDEDLRTGRAFHTVNVHSDMGGGWRAHWEEQLTWSRLWTADDMKRFCDQARAAGFSEEADLLANAVPLWTELQKPRAIVDAYFPQGSLAMNRVGTEPFTDEHIILLERFTEVFALGYRRHLDLKAAEERARQLAVENAAQRLRSEALAMRSTEDLNRLVAQLWREMVDLGVQTPGASFTFIDDDARTFMALSAHGNPRRHGISWTGPDVVEVNDSTVVHCPPAMSLEEARARTAEYAPEFVSLTDGTMDGFISRWRSGAPWSHSHAMPAAGYSGEWSVQFSAPLPEWAGKWIVTNVPFGRGAIGYREREASDEHIEMVRQLADSLSIGYLRFLDFQKLEEQNRQANIARARQCVRAEVMAMRSADDIEDVVTVLQQELRALGVACDGVGFNIIDQEAGVVRTSWTSTQDRSAGEADDDGVVRLNNEETTATARLFEHWRRREVWSRARSDDLGPGTTGWVVDVPFEYGTLAANRGLRDAEAPQFTPEDIEILSSFADVVSLGYTRFLDFQRLEEQNRRLAAESALERIRAEVASMESTADIGRVVGLSFSELVGLGVQVGALTVAVVDEDEARFRQYVVIPQEAYEHGLRGTPTVSGVVDGIDLYRSDRPFYVPTDWALDLWRSGVGKWRVHKLPPGYFQTEEIIDQYRTQFGMDITGVDSFPTHHLLMSFSHGVLVFNSSTAGGPSEGDVATIREFARMLSLGYARFLDFQAAEERARELTIDRAVERVRAEATAMQQSSDIGRVMAALYDGWRECGLAFEAGTINIVDSQRGRYHCYALAPAAMLGELSAPERLVAEDVAPGLNLYRSLELDLEFARQRGWAQPDLRSALWEAPETFPEDLEAIWGCRKPEWDQYVGCSGINVPFSHGGIFAQAPAGHRYGEADMALVARFADAMSLGYTRFLDLQAAEQQAAQQARSAAAERMRTAAMAMQSPRDICRVLGVLSHEMAALGLDTPGCQINFIDPRTDEVVNYGTNLNPRKFGLTWESPDVVEIDEDIIALARPVGGQWAESIRALHRKGVPESEKTEFTAGFLTDFVVDHWQMSGEEFAASELATQWVGEWTATSIPFEQGVVTYHHRFEGEDHIAIVQELARGLSLGVVRFLDFQRLEEQNKALEHANQEIQQANRLKSEFLANMSHELRTPLNAIVGFSKLVYRKAKGVLDPRQVGNLEKVLQSSEILLALINDILDLSKIEAGRLEILPEEFDIRELVAGCLDTVGPMVKRGVKVEADLSEEVGVMYSDPSRVRQILVNLLSNAGKFTESGTITVGLKPAGDNLLELSVTDTGMGIPRTALDTIFEEFRQVDGTTTRKYGGTGLGLSISQRLAGMLGGCIRVESEEGVGSTFTVSIAARYGLRVAAEKQPAGAQVPAGRRIVLCIDDDPNVISLITQELEEEGYQVVGAARAVEGIQKAHSMKPCAITLDIMMPGMDGWEAITRLKGDPATRDIPIIVVSIIDNRELGFRLGADEYLVKPVEKEALLHSLRRFARGNGKALVVDDDPAVVELLTQLLEEDGWEVRSAANGSEGLKKLRRHPPDVVLLDLLMPVMDGFETLKKIRASRSAKIRDLPVIIVTAKDLSAQEREALLESTTRIIEKDGLDRKRLLHELRDSLVGMRS